MKKILLIKFLLFFCLNFSQAITWNGSVDSNWNNPMNWNGGVLPIPSDFVVILNKPNQPTLNVNATVSGVNVFADATFTINAGTTLNVDASGTAGNAFTIVGTVINKGTITLVHDHITAVSLVLSVNSTFENEGTFQLNGNESTIGIDLSPGAKLINKNIFSITNPDRVQLYSRGGTITNEMGKTITGTNCYIVLESSSTLNNNGTLELDLVDETTIALDARNSSVSNGAFATFEIYNATDAIVLTGSFFSNFGDLDIHNCERGIVCTSSSNFINYQSIIIDVLSDIAITNSSSNFGAGFRNGGGATISMDNCLKEKINVAATGTTINEGEIYLLPGNPPLLSGDITGPGLFVNEVSGTLKGNINLTNTNRMQKGTMKPGHSPGLMTADFTGFVLAPTSIVDIEIAGTGGPGAITGHDQLSTAGFTLMNGTLNVTLLGGFTPVIGNSFVIVSTALTVNGAFTSENLPTPPAGTQWDVEYNSDNVTLKLTSILPVDLTSFNAEPKENGVALDWATASEEENSGFEIQKSSTGLSDWKKLGFVNGRGNSSVLNTYSFIDEKPYSGNNYYRLKQIDFDGDMDYSKIVNVKIVNDNNFEIYPNPISNLLFIEIQDDFEKGILQLFNSSGQLVLTHVLSKYNQINIAEQNFPAGIYKAEISLDKVKSYQGKLVIIE